MLNHLATLAEIGLTGLSVVTPHIDSTPVPNDAQAYSITVQQGDKVVMKDNYNGGWQRCTVGYSDARNGHLHLAAHCFRGDGVLYDPFMNRIGKVVASGDENVYDAAIVEVDNGIIIGPNNYSGDVVVDAEDLVVCDEICMYGVSSNRVRCDEITYLSSPQYENAILTGPDMAPIPGDSGGPAWVPGKGFVGVGSHWWEIMDTGEITAGEWSQSHHLAEDLGVNLPMYEGVHDPVPVPMDTPPLSSMSSMSSSSRR